MAIVHRVLALWVVASRLFTSGERTSDAEEALSEESLAQEGGEAAAAAASAAWHALWHGPHGSSAAARRPFGQCPARQQAAPRGAGGAAGPSAAVLAQRSSAAPDGAAARLPLKPPCEDGTLIAGFGVDGQYKDACCKLPSTACAGCGALGDDGKCVGCTSGFVVQHGRCVACDDVQGWKDVSGATCVDYELQGKCDGGVPPGREVDVPFHGLRPSEACCACGGGQLAPTPWRYALSGRALLFGKSLADQPAPQTADRHEVSKDCSIGDLNLTFSGGGVVSGTLPLYSKGRQKDEAVCTVSAVQDELSGLSFAAELRLSLQPLSYGPKVVVFAFEDESEAPVGNATWPLQRAGGLVLANPPAFRATCVPAAPWVKVDPATGALSYIVGPHDYRAGLSGGPQGTESASCLLSAKEEDGKEVQAAFVVVKAFVWSEMHYPQALYARKGRPLRPILLRRTPPKGFEHFTDQTTGRMYWYKSVGGNAQGPGLAVPPAVRPVVQAVQCSGAPNTTKIHWSRKTGLVTVNAQPAFVINPRTGDVSGQSEVKLSARLGLASLELTCKVAAGGELYGRTLVTTLSVELLEDTCWHSAKPQSPIWFVSGRADIECASQCRDMPDCGAYWQEDGACRLQTSTSHGAIASPASVFIRTSCEEGVSCLEFKNSHTRFLEGRYCPKGKLDGSLCNRFVAGKSRTVQCEGATQGKGYLLYSLRSMGLRFGASSGNDHFLCVSYSGGKWLAHDAATPRDLEAVPSDVLVAEVDFAKRKVETLQGRADVVHGIRKGYASGHLTYAVGAAGTPLGVVISGDSFVAWECAGGSSPIYFRSGVTAQDQMYLARSSCVVGEKIGIWTVHRANETDYMNPDTGALELRGDVLACLGEEVERGVFESGSTTSVLWLPDTHFQQPYDAVSMQLNGASQLQITASLVAEECPAPETGVEGLRFGTVSEPDFFALDACECFGLEHRGSAPVTPESGRSVELDDDETFNIFKPEPQLLSVGPFVCEDRAVLPFGQKNDLTEEACQAECIAASGACRFYMYVPQLRFCTLLSSCTHLGHTGLDISHKLYGVFESGSQYCRIADPEKCWTSKRRRELLEGTLGMTDECAFQEVLARCDLLSLATAQSAGECGRCAYYPTSSKAAEGRKKRPLPAGFPGGSQLTVSCGDGASLVSEMKSEGLGKTVVTCTSGQWINERGKEGLSEFACSSCVQVAQPQLGELLASSAPEIYFLSKRRLQYHYGVVSSGCLKASSYATAAPLRSERGTRRCLQVDNPPRMGFDCGTSWFQDFSGHIVSAGRNRHCLSFADGHLSIGKCGGQGPFHMLGPGYCDEGFYEGWKQPADATLEKCQAKCMSEEKCRFIALVPGRSCSRYDGKAGDCSRRSKGQAEHTTYARSVPPGSVWDIDRFHRLRSPDGRCLEEGEGGELALADCASGRRSPSQSWYFDGGDCSYGMQLRGLEKPLKWRFELSQGAVLGSEMRVRESQDLEAMKKSMDSMSFGTCDVSLSASLDNKDTKDDSIMPQLQLQNAEGKAVEDRYTKSFMVAVGERTLFVCSPGGPGGPKVVQQWEDEKSKKEGALAKLKVCAFIQKALKPNPATARIAGNFGDRHWTARAPGSTSNSSAGVVSGLWSKHDNGHKKLRLFYNRGTQDRQWRVAFAKLKGGEPLTLRNRYKKRKRYFEETTDVLSTVKRDFNLTCGRGWVLTGFSSPGRVDGDRQYQIECGKVNEADSSYIDKGWTEWKNQFDHELSYSLQVDEFIGGIQSEWSSYNEDRKFKFQIVKLCLDRSKEINAIESEIKELEKKIAEVSSSLVSCSTGLQLSVDKMSKIQLNYPGSEVKVQANARCSLLYPGEPRDTNKYELTATQVMDMARAASYHAVSASSHKAEPFRSGREKAADAQRVGWFSILDSGATVWGLHCESGSVVAVHSDAGSPHCVEVGARDSDEDVLADGAMPASAVCEPGYAVAGWYNLLADKVKQASALEGGPKDPIGFRLTCRSVPGLSRLCEYQEGRCDKDQVVTGIQYEEGLAIRYKCCKVPRVVGQHFADNVLRGLKPWEGYYCPARVDDTGRPEYTLAKTLGRQTCATALPEEIWPVFRRSTEPKDDKGGQASGWVGHEVFCGPGEVLSQWRMVRGGSFQATEVFVLFSCLKLPMDPEDLAGMRPSGCAWRQTTPAATLPNMTNIAENVQCQSGEAMSGFKFLEEPSKKKYYRYLCCKVVVGPSRKLSTTASPLSRASDFRGLSEHDVACARGEAMIGFKWLSSGSFEYNCAGVATKWLTPTREEAKLRWNKFRGVWSLSQATHLQHLGYLMKLQKEHVDWRVSCPAGFSASGFAFELWGEGLASLAGHCRSTSLKGAGTAAAGCKRVTLGAKAHTGIDSLTQNALACAAGSVLKSFAYLQNAQGQVELVGTCCNSAEGANATCSKHKSDTKSSALGYDGLSWMRVKCPPGASLTGFQLKPQGAGELGFDFDCCKAEAEGKPQGAIFSSAADTMQASAEAKNGKVKIEAGKATTNFTVNGREIPGAGENCFNVLILAPGFQDVKVNKWFASVDSQGLAKFLNAVEDDEALLLGAHGKALEQLTGEAIFALQRLGSTLNAAGHADKSYALVGTVGSPAVAEGLTVPSDEESAVAEGELAPKFAAAPVADFTAAFVSDTEQKSDLPKHPPVKPKLLAFKPKEVAYDEFCDLGTRNFKMASIDCEEHSCPNSLHPCAHTYENQVTEQKFWQCQQRDIDREYLLDVASAEQEKFEGNMEWFKHTFDLAESVGLLAATGSAAWAMGSHAVTAEEGSEAATDTAEDAAKKAAGSAWETAVQQELDPIRSAMEWEGKKSVAWGAYELGRDQVLYKGVNSAFEKTYVQEGSEAARESGGKENAFNVPGTDRLVSAIPKVRGPDPIGMQFSRDLADFATADWLDCHPFQLGLSKMMCDLYCTEQAVKEGNSAILQSIRSSNSVLTRNVERLLDYHTNMVLWAYSQKHGETEAALLWKPGERDASAGGGADLPEELRGAFLDLQALPRLLEADPPGSNSSGLRLESAAWHRDASEQLLNSLQRVFDEHLVPGGDAAVAAQRATQLVQRFGAERALRLEGPSAEEGGAAGGSRLGRMTSQKAERLRWQVRGARRHLEASSGLRPPALALPEFDAPASDEAAARLSDVSEALVAAHERHAVFVQTRERALQAAEAAVDSAESYVACEGEDLQGLHALWQRAYRLEDEAASKLLRAWAATVAAQERLQLAVREGLVGRVAETATLPGEGDEAMLAALAGPCDGLQPIAERSHELGVHALDKALWPLLQQVVALESLANHQERELKSKRLDAVARLPVGEALAALRSVAVDRANPATAAGRQLAARALDLLGPAACPAPAACTGGGMLLVNASVGAVGAEPLSWTSSRPGDLLLGEPAERVARACRSGRPGQRAHAASLQQTSQHAAGAAKRRKGAAEAGGRSGVLEAMQELVHRFDRVSSHLGPALRCGEGCEEHLRVHLTEKRTIVGSLLQRMP